MKLLYVGMHPTMEHDELSIFSSLGIDCFSVGNYLNPLQPTNATRPPLNLQPKPELITEFEKYNPTLDRRKIILTKEIVKDFDVVLVSHFTRHLDDNWDLLKDKFVIWRTFGLTNSKVEQSQKHRRKQIKIVRTSERELHIHNNLGIDAVIRASCNPAEFKDWNGKEPNVLTVTKRMKSRPAHCYFNEYCQITKGLPRKLYGTQNENISFSGGSLTYKELINAYRNNRVFLSMGTRPGSYTYTFLEAWMTGCPVVTIGPNLGGPGYEVPSLVENGVDGFWFDNFHAMRERIKSLLKDYELACKISKKGRKKAIDIFGVDKVTEDWKTFFTDHSFLL